MLNLRISFAFTATIGGVVLVVVANINTCPDKIGNVAMMSQVNNISSNATSLLLFNGKWYLL